ncbi:IclR family transcriptional regulator [Neobacillus sp. 114]|uniref:IclR family transcriptional regulator n=1 Tax=Neobacillus sp. 114 TaxID=3048535 RepID=UPI0024C469F1|nr:IclR family transcriptional regulator [Neobacillus sp. 114]
MNNYHVPAVHHSVSILKLLSRYKYSNSTLAEISQALSISKSSCMRILKTLEEERMVSYNQSTKRYSLGPSLVVLGSRASEQIDYHSLAKPLLEKLTSETSLTSFLVERISGDRLMYIAKEESTGMIQIKISVGNRFPIKDVSYGKWFLAYMEENERDEILKGGLTQITPYTITDISEYIKTLDVIRKDGVLVSKEEYIEGVVAVSAPVFNSNRDIQLVIGTLGFSTYMTEKDIDAVVQKVKDTANEFTSKLAGEIDLKIR